MYWIAIDDVVDFIPERLHGPKHSTLPVMLTNKQFHRDLSKLIHEKQEVINIVIDGSRRDQRRPGMFRGYVRSGKRVSATPWHGSKKVRFHLQPGLAAALTDVASSSSFGPGVGGPSHEEENEKKKPVMEERERCKRIMLGAFIVFCIYLNGQYCVPPKLKGLTKVEILFHEDDEDVYASSMPSIAVPGAIVPHSPPAPFWTLGDVYAIVSQARKLRDLQIEPSPIQCACRGRLHDHTMPWRNDPKSEVSFCLPNLAYIVSANDPVFDESGARRHYSILLGRLWHRPREWMYSDDINDEDCAEIKLQQDKYQKWLEDGNGDLRCIVVRDLQLLPPEEV